MLSADGTQPFLHPSFAGNDVLALERIVNVASVSQLSPFRYPGGKTWLAPRAIRWLKSIPRPTEFVEPFAGGGIISLTVADRGLADHVIMVERDEQVAATWQAVLGGDAGWLVERIMSFEVTPESVQACLEAPAAAIRERAFKTIVKNRTFHGGILAPGSAVIKYGENGKGIRSRWYPETLKKRILKIAELRDRITFIEGDGLRFMEQRLHEERTVFFIDPPYTAAGKRAGSRLYTHSELDHERLFSLAGKAAGSFLMTYDEAQGVRELGQKHGFQMRVVAMKNTHHAKMEELLLGRDLSWLE
jgi:DNA adenine methylase